MQHPHTGVRDGMSDRFHPTKEKGICDIQTRDLQSNFGFKFLGKIGRGIPKPPKPIVRTGKDFDLPLRFPDGYISKSSLDLLLLLLLMLLRIGPTA